MTRLHLSLSLALFATQASPGVNMDLPRTSGVRFEPSGNGVFDAQLPSRRISIQAGSWAIGGGISFRQLNTRSGAVARGREQLGSVSNYLIGGDPARWRLNVSHFAEVFIEDLYPGIDMVCHGKGDSIEYDLLIAPGASVKHFAAVFDGASGISLTPGGDMKVHTPAGGFLQKRPVAYQSENGRRIAVKAEFVIMGNRFGIETGPYDTARPLIIDPEVDTTTTVGGNGNLRPRDAVVDAAGNMVVVGETNAGGNATQGAFQPAVAGGADGFAGKFSPSGQLLFLTYLGGNLTDGAYGVDVDSEGRIYVGGGTNSTNFPVTPGAFQGSAPPGSNGFIVRLSPTGSPQFSTYVGFNRNEIISDISVGPDNQPYYTGTTDSTNVTTTPNFTVTSPRGQLDVLVGALNTSGTALVLSGAYGGAGSDTGKAIGWGLGNSLVIVGDSGSADFPVTSGALQRTLRGTNDVFVSVFDATGGRLSHSTLFGGGGAEAVNSFTMDHTRGYLLLGGFTASVDFPIAGPLRTTYQGGNFDGWMSALPFPSTTGFQSPAFSMLIGGANNDGINHFVYNPATDRYHFFGVTVGDAKFPVAGTPVCAGTGFSGYFALSSTGPLSAEAFARRFVGECSRSAPLRAGFTAAGGWRSVAEAGTAPNFSTEFISRGDTEFLTLTEASDGGVEAGDPVLVHDGSVYSIQSDLLLPGPLPLEFERHYHSRLEAGTGLRGALGPNWQHNFEMALRLGGSSNATLVTRRAAMVRFRRTTSGWQLASPSPTPYQLVQQDTLFRLLDPRAGLIYTFNQGAAGRLERIETRNQAALTLEYRGAQLFRVADGRGRFLEFAYEGLLLSSLRDSAGNTVRFSYQGGLLESVTDASGNRTSYEYRDGDPARLRTMVLPGGARAFENEFDAQGRVTVQRGPGGGTIALAYDTPVPGKTTETRATGETVEYALAGTRLSERTDENGNTSRFIRDGLGRLLAYIDREGNRTQYTYHAPSGFVESATLPDGAKFTFTYLASPRAGLTFFHPASLSFPDGSRETYTYDERGNLTQRLDRAGRQWRYAHDTAGQLTSITLPDGGVIRHTYQPDGRRATTEMPATGTIRHEYDSTGRRTGVTLAEGGSRRVNRNAAGDIVSISRGSGSSATYTPDGRGGSSQLTNAAGFSSSAVLAASGRPAEVTATGQQKYRFIHDELDRLTGVQLPDGSSASIARDAAGIPVGIIDADGRQWRFETNKEGDLTAMTSPSGSTVRWEHDARRRVAAYRTSAGNQYRLSYDSMSRLISVMDPAGESYGLSYDRLGQLTGLSFPEEASIKIERAASGLPTAVVASNGDRTSFERDGAGRVIAITSPLGERSKLTRDGRGRIQKITTPEGEADLQYAASGQLTRITGSGGLIIDRTFDARGLFTGGTAVTIENDASGSPVRSNGIAVEYSERHRVTRTVLASGKAVSYSHTPGGQLARVEDWMGGVTSMQYDADGRLVSIDRPNGARTVYAHDEEGRWKSIEERLPEKQYSILIERDSVGRKTRVKRDLPLVPSASALERLVAAAEYGRGSTVNGFTYDRVGRRTSDGARRYQWDTADRLRVMTAGGADHRFEYDALHHMVSRASTDGTASFVWNYAFSPPSPAIIRRDGEDAAYFVFTPDGRLLYSIDAGTGARSFHHFDEAGNTIFLTDDSGSISASYAYSPYGRLLDRTGDSANPFLFLGQFGVIGLGGDLYYHRRRVYDAASAAFLSPEPKSSIDPRAMSPYQYAFGSPLERVDHGGLEPSLTPDSLGGQAAEAVNFGAGLGDKLGDGAVTGAGAYRLWHDGLSAIRFEGNSCRLFAEVGLQTGFERMLPALEYHLKDLPFSGINRWNNSALAEWNRAVCPAKTLSALDTVGKVGDGLALLSAAASAVTAQANINQAEEELDSASSGNYDLWNRQAAALREAYKAGRITGAEYRSRLKALLGQFDEMQTAAENNFVYTAWQESLDFAANGLDAISPVPFVKDLFGFAGSFLPTFVE